jgi:prepilin-type N-terminal cleavage/methylation domain-containing protein
MINNERGMTLAEILVAVAIIGIAVIALMAVVPVSGYGIQEGNQLSTATFLAQQRMEQVRNAAWNATTDCVGLSANATSAPKPSGGVCAGLPAAPDDFTFADEAGLLGTSTRTVRITGCDVAACGVAGDPAAAGMRLVTVLVNYRPLSGGGAAPALKAVTLQWLVAQR